MQREIERAAFLEIEALLRAAAEAADVLRQEATILRECHTLNGEWDGSEPEIEAGYNRLMALAARLTSRVRGASDGPRSK